MNSLVPLFQILKGIISNCPRFPLLPALVFVGALSLSHPPIFGETIQITPKNGVPSSWDLVSVEPDRIIVRKGGARFEFSRDQIEKVSNSEVSKLVARARVLLSEVEKLDPPTFPKIETEMEKILPSLERAAQQFNWLMPELVEVRDRVAETKDAIGKTLDLTSGFGPDLEAIEKMAGGKSPVATNWEEVVENTLKGAQEIPIAEIRTQVVEDLNTFRRSIRLSLVRRTEETEKRVRSSGENLLADLAKGEIDRAQWTLRLRDLRRQVAEQVPDADLRLELEEYLNQMEANSEEKLVAAEEKIAQRQIGKSIEALESLVLDTTKSEEFVAGAEAISAEIAQLPDSATRKELEETLEIYRFDHQEALAQLQRSEEPNPPPKPAETRNETPEKTDTPPSLLSDWRVIAGAVLALVVLLGAIKVLLSKLGKGKRTASEIEDVKVVSLQPTDDGWAGGQDEDLSAMLGSSPKSTEGESAVIESAGEVDLFGDPSPTEEEEDDSDDAPVVLPTEESEPKSEDPFGFSTVFSDEELETVEDLPTSDDLEPTSSETDELFGPPPSEAEKPSLEPGGEPASDPLTTEADPLEFLLPSGSDEDSAEEIQTDSDPAPDPDPLAASEDADDPFGLLSSQPQSEPEKPDEEIVEDLFDSPKPSEAEEDIFGFGNYFDESDSDSDKPS